MSFDPHAPDVAAALEALDHVGAGIIAEIDADSLRALVERVQMRRCQYMHGGTETMFCTLACKHYTVTDEDGYARTYDDDDDMLIRAGDMRAVLDVATMSMDFASGFLVEEQVEALRKVAGQLGIDPLLATPHNFVCKYGGTHEWRPMTLGNDRTPRLQPTESDELLARLTAAKAGTDAAELQAAKEAVRASRTKAREANSPWTQPANSPRRPLDICPLCNHTRPSPAVWSTATGRYLLELVIHLQPRYAADDPGPLLDGLLTLYEESNVGELVLDQRRVAVGNPDDPDDRLVWILWATDRLALSQPGRQPPTWISPAPGVSPQVVSRDQPKAPEEEL